MAETALAIPIDVTLKPPGGVVAVRRSAEGEPETVGKAAWTRPDPSELPRLSLSFADRPAGPVPESSERADLEVRGLLGEGGMGRVHAAHQRSLDREVAIKTLRAPSHEVGIAALLREAVVTGRLEHPGIVPVHALGLDEHGAPLLVMKRVEGTHWRSLLEDAGHPGWSSRPGDRLSAHIEILMQVCQAVHFAHSRGVVHCDIKPENVMLGDFGEVYLVDWGIAMRLEDPAARERDGLVGTPAYIAPELVGGKAVGPYTDVYLLGSTLHHVLTGCFRHSGSTLQEALLSAFCSEPFSYDDSVPDELAELCNRATRREPTERFASALELRKALADFLTHRGSIALAEEARGRLDALSRLLESGGSERAPEDLKLAYQLASEARFGFTQALKEWAVNPSARGGLTATIVSSAELELRQGHVQTAEALLAELGEIPAELAERVRRARKAHARSLAENDRLRAMAHDMDTSVAERERTRGLATLSGASLAIAAYALSQPNPNRIKPEGLLTFALVVLVAMLAGVAIWRKRLFANAFSKKSVTLLLLAALAIVASRVIGVSLQMPAALIFTQDLFVLSAMAATASIAFLPGLWLLAGMLLGAAMTSVYAPGWSAIAFSFTGVLTPPLIALALWNHRVAEERAREEAAPPESTLLE